MKPFWTIGWKNTAGAAVPHRAILAICLHQDRTTGDSQSPVPRCRSRPSRLAARSYDRASRARSAAAGTVPQSLRQILV